MPELADRASVAVRELALPRLVFAYIDVRTPSSADRRPSRDEPEPRRIRAAAPAHAPVFGAAAAFLEFARLIERRLPMVASSERRPPPRRETRNHPWSRTLGYSNAPPRFISPVGVSTRDDPHRGKSFPRFGTPPGHAMWPAKHPSMDP